MKPEDISPDFEEWPERWMYVQEDVAYGKGLLPLMHAFIVHLISKGLTRKTIRRAESSTAFWSPRRGKGQHPIQRTVY